MFALLFTVTALAQYFFLWGEIKRRSETEFDGWASQIQRELNYQNHWDLKKYRQADWDAPGCFIYMSDGLAVDIEGFVPGYVEKVDWPQNLAGEKPLSMTSEIGESWRLLEKKVTGGVVLLGIADPTSVPDADSILLEDAKIFGDSLTNAVKVDTREINVNVNYAVVDGTGNLRFAIGGFPLRIVSMIGKSNEGSTILVENNGKQYEIFKSPILDVDKKIVGWLAIPNEVTLARRTLRNSVWFNIALSIGSWLVLGVLTANYFIRTERVKQFHQVSLDEALAQDESDTLEFKSSLRWDRKLNTVNRNLEQAVVKTVVAFLNTNGGVLLIGVGDDKSIRGLEADYESFSKKNRDGFQLHLQQMLSQAVGVDRNPSHTMMEFHKVQDKDICLVRIKPASKPVVIREQNQPILYVRAGGASKTLNVEEALRYVQDHWGGYI